MVLPPELVDSLNQIYFLHLLVNDKGKVVPPGKSVLSMLMHANFRLQQESDKHADLVERVKEAAHKAFWREVSSSCTALRGFIKRRVQATEVLSSPMPFVQLPRLRRLNSDIHEALEPLFPPNHRILVTLAAPPPPTSSPLLSTVNLLKEVLIALRERCAPIRDEQVDALLSTISFPPTAVQRPRTASPDGSSSELQISPLAQFVIDNIRAILSVAEDMKSDLNNFVLGSMTEEQLMDVLSTEVESREREFILHLWGGKEEIRDLWLSWSQETSRQHKVSEFVNYKWIDRLLKALEADKPVICFPPKHMSTMQDGTSQPVPNNLPPQFFFVVPTLVYLQNYLQAVIITASLQILARPPHSTVNSSYPSIPPSNDADLRRDFAQHVWTLLKAEIDADSIDNPSFDGSPTTTTSNNIPEIKLINLADEVVRARRVLGGRSLNPDEEKQLRDSVDRTLRTSDPVFMVLRKRLFNALEDKLLHAIGKAEQDARSSTKPAIPERMQTGRTLSMGSQKKMGGIDTTRITSASNPLLKALLGDSQDGKTDLRFNVMGFEHAVLKDAIAEAYRKLSRCIFWTVCVWGTT